MVPGDYKSCQTDFEIQYSKPFIQDSMYRFVPFWRFLEELWLFDRVITMSYSLLKVVTPRPCHNYVVTMSLPNRSKICKLWLFDHIVTMSYKLKSCRLYDIWCTSGHTQCRFQLMSIPTHVGSNSKFLHLYSDSKTSMTNLLKDLL